MEIKQAIDYLRQIADSATLPNYAAALDTAIRSMEEVEALRKELERVKQERDAAIAAVDSMAEYIVTVGRVDYWLCDDIPRELHLKHQPKDDGDYENEPCIECVKEYYLSGQQKEGQS